jgi:hypothetical protein
MFYTHLESERWTKSEKAAILSVVHYRQNILICTESFSVWKLYVRFEVFTAVTMKNAVFWNVMPCGSCENWRSGGMCRLHHQGETYERHTNSDTFKKTDSLKNGGHSGWEVWRMEYLGTINHGSSTFKSHSGNRCPCLLRVSPVRGGASEKACPPTQWGNAGSF